MMKDNKIKEKEFKKSLPPQKLNPIQKTGQSEGQLSDLSLTASTIIGLHIGGGLIYYNMAKRSPPERGGVILKDVAK